MSQTYNSGSAAYSPSAPTADLPQNPGAIHTHKGNPLFLGNAIAAPVVPAPPSPSVGGQTNTGARLGWSTGLRRVRHLHARFTGRTLVVPTMGAHPAVGPVGQSTRSDRLIANVNALYGDYLPSAQDVAASFTGGRNRNPLSRVMGDNAND